MITKRELNKKIFPLTPEQNDNLDKLLVALNKLRAIWAKPMIITSGFRSKEDHLRIYAGLGITDESKIPMGSKHLSGLAADISDPNFELTKFCKENDSKVLVNCGLYAEDDMSVKRLHLQIVPPKSGNRWFKP